MRKPARQWMGFLFAEEIYIWTSMFNRNDVVQRYMNGYCMYLAAALHHEYGFPISVSLVPYGAKYSLYHCWVTLPNKMCLDIKGEQTLEAISGTMGQKGSKVVCNVSIDELDELCDWIKEPLAVDNTVVARALEIAQLYLADSLQVAAQK